MKMNYEALFLFLIILLGLLLCSFLGGNCHNEGFTNKSSNELSNNKSNVSDTSYNGTNYDNYNHYRGTSNALTTGTTYFGPNGGTIVVVPNGNGTQSLQVVLVSGNTPIIYAPSETSNNAINVFYGPQGGTATIIKGNNGLSAIRLDISSGTYIFVQSKSELSSTEYYGSTGYNNSPSTSYYEEEYNNPYAQPQVNTTTLSGQLQNGTVFYGPNGGKILVTTNNSNTQILQVTIKKSQQPMIFVYQPPVSGNQSNATYYGPNGSTATVMFINNEEVIQVNTNSGIYTFTEPGSNSYNANFSSNTVNGPYGGSATTVNGPYGGSAYYAQGPNGNTVAGTTPQPSSNSSTYTNSLPPGIPASQIPPGNEDLYILKSEIVPPVCPVCPTINNTNSSSSSSSSETCPPCPACARCPEPSFECKKVPNYNTIDNDYLPIPVLNDFSTFGM